MPPTASSRFLFLLAPVCAFLHAGCGDVSVSVGPSPTGAGPGPQPGAAPIETVVVPAPADIEPGLSPAARTPEIVQALGAGLLIGEPVGGHVRLEVDPLGIPWAELCEIRVEPLSLTTASGTALPLVLDSQWAARRRLRFDPEFKDRIIFPLANPGEGEPELGSARMRVSIVAPASYEKLTISTNSLDAASIEKGGVRVRVETLRGDTLGLVVDGAEDLRAVARNSNGDTIARHTRVRVGKRFDFRFLGVIDEADLYALRGMREKEFDLEVDLARRWFRSTGRPERPPGSRPPDPATR